MECPLCGVENKEDAAFCMSCGASLPDTPFSQLKKEEDRPRPAPPSAAAGAGKEEPVGQPGKGAAVTATPGGTEKAAVQEPTVAMPADGGATSQASPPSGEGAVAPGPQVTSPGGFVFGGAAVASPGAEDAQSTPPAPTPAAEVPGAAEKPPPQVPPAAAETQTPAAIETPTTAPSPPPQATPPPEPEYYVPPEADVVAVAPGLGSSPPAEPAIADEAPAAEAPALPSLESTQAVAPVAAAAAVAGRESRIVCPECYAPNQPGNGYCQECGSALPVTSMRQAASAHSAPGQPGYQQTSVLAPEIAATGAAQPAYPGAVARARVAQGEKSFGVADILAVIAVGASAVAIALSFSLESFWWKKGMDIGMFSHQGAYSQGRSDLLGGPGVLPYEGAEFLTIGLVVAVGLALALIFLAVRTGRGPMYLLSGCILTFPIAYLFFQAILPLRQMGIDIGSAVGLRGIFFGDAANAGVGPPLWIITAAGVLLILAGFLAPPRGWGRLLTFGLCFSIILGAAFFCAACFNWNLFISEPSTLSAGAGTLPAKALYALLL